MENNMEEFIEELCKLSGVSKIYATAAWYTRRQELKLSPKEYATAYYERFLK